jgi:hypothetical protein
VTESKPVDDPVIGNPGIVNSIINNNIGVEFPVQNGIFIRGLRWINML